MRTWDQAPHAIWLLIAAFTAFRLLLAAVVPLFPEEAYYWSWSQHLDWSYFDHPPLVAWAIALTTAPFGSTAFAVKLAAVLWSLGWNLVLARLVLDMYGDRRLAFWSIATLNLTILYEAFGIGPTPDGPLIFAWLAVLWSVWRASQSGDGRWWYAAGTFLGLAWLGKYTGVLLLPVVLLYLLSSPAQRRWLARPEPWLAILLAFLIFSPVIIWNAQHGWVSFSFQSTRRVSGMGGFQPRYLAVLVVTQILLLTPYIFLLCVAALWRNARNWLSHGLDDRTRLLLLSAAVPIALFSAISLRTLSKSNWLATAFGPLIILGVHHLLSRADGLKRLSRGLASSALIVALVAIAIGVPNLPLPFGMNSWSGWIQAAKRVNRISAEARAEGHGVFVFSPNYRISSLLRFLLPGQPRTYAQDIYGLPALQFDFFPLERSLSGATGILVTSDEDRAPLELAAITAHFDACLPVDAIEAKAFGKTTRRIQVFRCSNYQGHPRLTRQSALHDNSLPPE